MKHVNWCFVSGVQLGVPALTTLCEHGLRPELVISYTPNLSRRSGYQSYAGVCSNLGLPNHYVTNDINSIDCYNRLKAHSISLIVVVGWSQLIGNRLLNIPRLGTVGMHPTPLPVGRGRAPIPWTILKDMRSSAVSLYYLDAGVDSGDLIAQTWFLIEDRATATQLYRKIGELQANMLATHLPTILVGNAPRATQTGPTSRWPRRTPSDGLIDWTCSGVRVDRMVRALTDPYPGAFTYAQNTKITVLKSSLIPPTAESIEIPGSNRPGSTIQLDEPRDTAANSAIGVICGDRSIVALETLRINDGPAAPATVALEYFDSPLPLLAAGPMHLTH